MPSLASFQFDSKGTQGLESAVPSEWLSFLDSQLTAIQSQFQQEDRAGYAQLIKQLRAWTWCHKVPDTHPDHASMRQIAEIATQVRQQAKVFVTVGIGGSDL
ncbi:MAG: hypothetical protein RBU29_17725, partial [bacterium]|nr:hypothetical protein [bacterium]